MSERKPETKPETRRNDRRAPAPERKPEPDPREAKPAPRPERKGRARAFAHVDDVVLGLAGLELGLGRRKHRRLYRLMRYLAA